MIYRLGKKLINLNGLIVHQEGDDPNWYAANGSLIGTIRLQALYLFLLKEEKAKILLFNKYVDEVIDELIYTKDEH